MAENSERITRRQFLSRTSRVAAGIVAAPLVSQLMIRTAWAEQSVDCPIYMFHLTTVAAVERVIRTNVGRLPITVNNLGAIMRGEMELSDRPLFCLTFDDGYLIQYTQAAPVLDRYGIPATFFVMGTDWQGDGVHTYMRSTQIQDLAERGHEIGSHTVNHANLVNLRTRNLGAYQGEIVSSKIQLEDLLNMPVTSFAFPNGAYNQAIVQDVESIYLQSVSELTGRTQTNTSLLRRVRP